MTNHRLYPLCSLALLLPLAGAFGCAPNASVHNQAELDFVVQQTGYEEIFIARDWSDESLVIKADRPFTVQIVDVSNVKNIDISDVSGVLLFNPEGAPSALENLKLTRVSNATVSTPAPNVDISISQNPYTRDLGVTGFLLCDPMRDKPRVDLGLFPTNQNVHVHYERRNESEDNIFTFNMGGALADVPNLNIEGNIQTLSIQNLADNVTLEHLKTLGSTAEIYVTTDLNETLEQNYFAWLQAEGSAALMSSCSLESGPLRCQVVAGDTDANREKCGNIFALTE